MPSIMFRGESCNKAFPVIETFHSGFPLFDAAIGTITFNSPNQQIGSGFFGPFKDILQIIVFNHIICIDKQQVGPQGSINTSVPGR